jgi:hypothetical protein
MASSLGWVGVAEDGDLWRALVNMVKSLWVLSVAEFLNGCTQGGFLSSAEHTHNTCNIYSQPACKYKCMYEHEYV